MSDTVEVEGTIPDDVENKKEPDVSAYVNVDPDDSKAHLINASFANGGGDHVDVKCVDGTPTSSEAEVSFNGLGKDEVMKYAEEPFWKKLRMILFILFWVGWFAMLVTAVVIILVAPRCPPRPDLKWYHTKTVYQVLPESFKDSDGDGKGDFKGLKDSNYVFDSVGAGAIWLNSIYETDELDSGRGIVDHKAIAPWFGASVNDIKSWLKTLRKTGKKLIFDLIPNQTSKNHTWFQKSRNGDAKFKDYYVWVDNTGTGSEPNNWKDINGKSAWTLDSKRNAWYLHQFSENDPDLNLQNKDVLDEIKDIMKFWLEAGVSGFNIRDVEYLVESPDLNDDDANKTMTRNFNGTLDVLEELRKVADSYSDKPGRERVLFATLQHADQNQASPYWGTKDTKRLNIVAPLMSELNDKCDIYCLKTMLEGLLINDNIQWRGYAFGNGDVTRIASRMKTKERLTIAHALQLLMPGTPFNYYGDEFGQKDLNGTANNIHRSPMQWNSEKNAGFTTGTPYIAIGSGYENTNVEAGHSHFAQSTVLEAFEELVELRENESFQWGKTKVCTTELGVLLFTRTAERFPYFMIMVNTRPSAQIISLKSLDCVNSKEEGTIRFHSRGKKLEEKLNVHDRSITLAPYDVVVIEFPSDG